MKRLFQLCARLWCAIAASASAVSIAADPPADLILHNATVYTVDAANSVAQAVAVRGGVIIAVGADAEILAHRGEQTRVIDLNGAFVLPGFNDNHIHFASAAAFHEFNIMRTSTQDEFVQRMRDVVATLPEGEWIVGGLWGAYDQWAEGSAGGEAREPFTPDVRLVEDITAKHPMFIRRFDNSEFAVNRAAINAAGLDPENPRVEGVEFVRDADGALTGIVRGQRAFRLFSQVVPRGFSKERRIRQTKNALRMIVAAGVTNVSDMSDWEQLEIFRELRDSGELTARIHFRPGLDEWERLAEDGNSFRSGDPWIRLGSLKGHIDGIMGTSSARFFEPYSHDPDNRGSWRRLMTDDDGKVIEGKFLEYMLKADAADLQVTVHAIGDEANYLLLDYLEELNTQNGMKDRRFRLVHAQVIAPGDFKRLGALNVIAEVQPFHLSDDMRWMEERIGRKRCEGAYAFKSIQDAGGMLCFGTDWPGTSAAEYPINPMLGLYAAVTRQTITGDPPGGWFPEQRISIEDAIRAYTYNTAYANFEDDTKGSIEVGKFADMAVLDRNLLEIEPRELLGTKVLYTIVDGKVVYSH